MTVKKIKVDPIPDDMTIHEASEFWDFHSAADYPSEVVHFEYNPEERVTFVAISNDFLEQLRGPKWSVP